MWDLEDLRLQFEGEPSIGAKEAWLGDPEFGVAGAVEHVATIAGEEVICLPVEKEGAASLLVGRQRVVETPHRIGRIRNLQNKVGEGLHLLVRELVTPSVQSLK